MNIKPKKRVVYECYRGCTDVFDTRVRKGTRVQLDFAGQIYYYFKKESGRGFEVVIKQEKFMKHFIPAAK
jgi:hypothetical protein